MLLDDFITLQGYNCILGNICNTMNYFNVNISEQDLFFLFSPFDGDRNLSEAFDKLYEDKGNNKWRDFVQKGLNDGYPIMISINPNVLPYINVEVGDSLTKHYVNIIGMDEKEKKLYVSDSYIPTYIPSTYEGWIDYNGISDIDIGNCWRIKEDSIVYFRNNYRSNDVNNLTLHYVKKRLSCFLIKTDDEQKSVGIDDLQTLGEVVINSVQNNNHQEMFKLLAGIRLNIINPLKYLISVFYRYPDKYGDWITKLHNLVNVHWESLNIKLLKFALAHKKLDVDLLKKLLNDAIELENIVLNDILKYLS